MEVFGGTERLKPGAVRRQEGEERYEKGNSAMVIENAYMSLDLVLVSSRNSSGARHRILASRSAWSLFLLDPINFGQR